MRRNEQIGMTDLPCGNDTSYGAALHEALRRSKLFTISPVYNTGNTVITYLLFFVLITPMWMYTTQKEKFWSDRFFFMQLELEIIIWDWRIIISQ